MSDNTVTINLNGSAVTLTGLTFTNHRTVPNPEKAGKKKREEFNDTIVAPVLTSIGDYVNLFSGILLEAEKRSAGNGVKLGFAVFKDRLVEANDTLTAATHAGKDEADALSAYTSDLVSISRAPSKGLSAADISEQLAAHAIELAVLMPLLTGTKQITEVVDANGKQVYADLDAATLRFAALDKDISRLQALNVEREARRAKIRADREQKAKAAAAAAAAPAPTEEAPAPAPQA